MSEKNFDKAHKIKQANDNVAKGKELLHDLPNKIKETEKFVEDCYKNSDYFLYINLHPTINKYRGKLKYHQLDFKIQYMILKSILEAIETFIVKEMNDNN